MLRGIFEKAGFAAENVDVKLHSEQHAFAGVKDLASLVDTPFAKLFTKGWEREDELKIPGLLEQALTEEEVETQSVKMIAWVVVAKK